MKVKLTKEHVNRAIEGLKRPAFRISECCPVFQALKDAGIPVRATYHRHFVLKHSEVRYPLPEAAVQITSVELWDWSKIKETEFEVSL